MLIASLAAASAPTFAQSSAPRTPSPDIPSREEVIVLSPFVVTTDDDTGYQSSNTLAGTKLRTSLKDIAASVSIINQEFLNDVGAHGIDDLLVYTLGTEVSGIGGNYGNASTGGNFTDNLGTIRGATSSTRVRGLASADTTRDYYITEVPLDSYNTERFEVNRGPNSILFGLGSPGGIINNGLIKAALNKDKTRTEFITDQNGTLRGSIDHNEVLIPQKAAVRVALLSSDKRFQQNPAFIRDLRGYLTVTAKPTRSTTVRVSQEWADQNSNKPQTMPPLDNFSYWFDIGKPVYDPTTGIASYLGTVPTDPNLQPITGTAFNSNALTAGWGNGIHPIMENPASSTYGVTGLPGVMGIEGSNSRVRLNGSGTQLANDGMRRLEFNRNYYRALYKSSHPEWDAFWRDSRITDPSIFNFYDEMLEGVNKYEWVQWNTTNINVEQMFGSNAGIELGYDRQDMDNGFANPYDFRSLALALDINTKLPNGLPNPNYARPMIIGSGWRGQTQTFREAYRATAFYDLDFVRGRDSLSLLQKLLGRHVFTGSYSGQMRDAKSYSGRMLYAGTDWGQAESALETTRIVSADNRALNSVVYLGPSLAGASSATGLNLSPVSAQMGIPMGGSINTLYYQSPAVANNKPADLQPWQNKSFTVDQNPRQDMSVIPTGANRKKDEVKSTVFVLNSYWYDSTLVSTVGWRRDDYSSYSATPTTNPANGFIFTDDNAMALAETLQGATSTVNYGLVLRLPPKFRRPSGIINDLALTYNKADNFQPTAQRFDLAGGKIENVVGNTEEFGVNLSLFSGKLDLRATKYETTAALQTNQAFRELIRSTLRRIESQRENNADPNYLIVADPAAVGAWKSWENTPDAQAFANLFEFREVPGMGWVYTDRTDVIVNTSDSRSRGYEFEITANPTKSWRLTFNAARTETVRTNTGESMKLLMAMLDPVWNGTAGALRNSVLDGNTLSNYYLSNVKIGAMKEILLDGSANPEVRKWRANFITNYSVSTGPLKGFNIGGAVRWQDKVAIGYAVMTVPNTTPAQYQYNVTSPYFGPSETKYDAWIGYSRVISKKYRWRIQLNVRSIGDGNYLIPTTAQPDGSIASWRICEPQTWQLTNTLEF
jgi:outer membrane receptor protein involved in Fe transport